jgi:Flp pilus assembly protein protease CpaA
MKRNVPLARVPIPYGVAISVGGLAVLYHLFEPVFFSS